MQPEAAKFSQVMTEIKLRSRRLFMGLAASGHRGDRSVSHPDTFRQRPITVFAKARGPTQRKFRQIVGLALFMPEWS